MAGVAVSNYAKLVAPMDATVKKSGERMTLAVGVQIKGVFSFDDGYTFAALLRAPYAPKASWVMFQTEQDLPGFTDAGRAHREAHRDRMTTLQQGRPRRSAKPSSRRLVCKVTDAQADYVERCAEQLDISVSEHVRRALIADGMPE